MTATPGFAPGAGDFALGPAVVPAGGYKYVGGVLLPDGRVALVPDKVAAVGLYDPATNGSAPAYALSRAVPPAVNALLLPYVNTL